MTSSPTPSHRRRRVLIVEDDTLVGLGLRSQLEKLRHDVVGEASTAAKPKNSIWKLQPDVVLMDIRLDHTDGIELAGHLLKLRRCPMVILSAFSDEELIARASAAGVFGYLIKPVSAESMAAQIEVSIQRFQEHEQLIADKAKVEAEKDDLIKLLETRKLVERAKGIFMKRLNLDEAEAHKRLQNESQKRRISLMELSKKIIESEDLLGG